MVQPQAQQVMRFLCTGALHNSNLQV